MDSESQSSAPQVPWQEVGWLERAASWAAEQIRQSRPGWSPQPELIHRTPWSAVVKLSNGGRPIFMKAVTWPFRHEIPLTELLASDYAKVSPVVLAGDIEQGWLLMAAGGQRLREAVKDRELVDHWLRLLPGYADLQIDLSDRANDLHLMGVPDRRPAQLADQYADLVVEAIRGGSTTDHPLTQREVERLDSERLRIHELLNFLRESSVAESLDHGDLHDGNVFTDRYEYSIFDWGDAGISFPFFSLRTIEASIENRLGETALLEARPALHKAYLGPWVERGGLGWGQVYDLLAAAERVWSIAAALRWQRAICALPSGQRSRYGHVLPSLLREVLQAAGDSAPH